MQKVRFVPSEWVNGISMGNLVLLLRKIFVSSAHLRVVLAVYAHPVLTVTLARMVVAFTAFTEAHIGTSLGARVTGGADLEIGNRKEILEWKEEWGRLGMGMGGRDWMIGSTGILANCTQHSPHLAIGEEGANLIPLPFKWKKKLFFQLSLCALPLDDICNLYMPLPPVNQSANHF